MSQKTHDEFVAEMAIKQPYIDVLGTYKNNKTHIECQCKHCKHKWNPIPNSLLRGSGCPQCWAYKQTSFAEQAIYFYCKQVTTAYNRYTNFGKEIDIYLPELCVGVEYNGDFWHTNRKDNDRDKINFFVDRGIRIITIKDGDINAVCGDVITHIDNDLQWAIETLFKLLHFSVVNVDLKNDDKLIYQNYLSIKRDNSFAAKFPIQSQQWDYDQNGAITPDMVSAKSHKEFYRICPRCGKSYKIKISNWTRYDYCVMCENMMRSGENSVHAKPIYVIDTNGEVVENGELYTIKKVADFLNVSITTVERRLVDKKPILIGLYKGCTISHTLTL